MIFYKYQKPMKPRLLLTGFVILVFSLNTLAATRYWIGGGSSTFVDGTHWSYTSGGGAIGGTISWGNTDVAIFDINSGSPTVTFTSSEYIDQLLISGAITVTFIPNTSASRTLTIGNLTSSDNLVVGSGSTLIIKGKSSTTDRNMSVILNNKTDINASISGYVKVMDDTDGGHGEFRRQSPSVVVFNAGSTYEHNSAESGADIPVANWASTSTCLITGIKGDMPGNLDQSFGNFTWNCTGQNASFNFPTMGVVQGNFTLNHTGSGGIRLSDNADVTLTIYGNYSQTGGSFWPSGGSANNVISLLGNFSLSGGFISSPGSGSCKFYFWNPSPAGGAQTYSMSGSGTFYQKIHFEISNTAVLDMGNDSIPSSTTGNFTLNSNCGLRTANRNGITASGASGSVQNNGSRSFPAGAHYTFYRNGPQNTGNGLQTNLSGVLTVGSLTNATILTNNSLTLSNKLVLISNNTTNSILSGNITYSGSNTTLEYQGNSLQVTTSREWPLNNGPTNVTSNNNTTVELAFSRTIGGIFNLAKGFFNIASNTLTLNGSLTQGTGAFNWNSNSGMIVGGTSGTALDLPLVTLKNLTLQRQNSGIRLTGNCTINGTMTMISGSVNLNGRTMSYGANSTLRYKGTTTQNTSSSEFPSSSGPAKLYIDNPIAVNLHASRTLNDTLYLNVGTFSIGSNTLTLNGIIFQDSCLLAGGSNSSMIFGGSGVTTSLPFIALKDLTIARASGISMNGNVVIGGNLNLSSGLFHVGSNTLSLNGPPINGTPTNLTTTGSSQLVFGGTSANIYIPTSVTTLGSLTIQNPVGVTMQSNIGVSGPASVSGYLNCSSFSLTGSGTFTTYAGSKLGIGKAGGVSATIQVSGTKTIHGLTDYEFRSASVNQNTGFLPTTPPNTIRNLLINNSAIVNYSENMTLEGALTVALPSRLVMQPSSSLTINGQVTLNGKDCIELQCTSDNHPTASLIINGEILYNAASVKAWRYIPNWTGPMDGWHLLSSPIDFQVIDPYFIEPDPENYDFYMWGEPEGLWLNQKVPENNITHFSTGEGYLIAYNSTNQMRTFSGQLNEYDVFFNNLTHTPDKPHRGWHLLGNPFSSALRWNDINWNLVNIGGICKVWQGDAGNYLDVNPLGTIPEMNGFMVWASNENNSLVIPLASRIHNNITPWYKNEFMEENSLNLSVSSLENKTACTSVVRFHSSSSEGFDLEYDCHFLPGLPEAPKFYSLTNEANKLSTNALPITNEKQIIKMDFIKGVSDTYIIRADGIDHFHPEVSIILEDKKQNQMIDLGENPDYLFSASASDDPARFRVHFAGITGTEERTDPARPLCYQSGNSIILNINPALVQGSEIIVYSMSGQIFFHDQISSSPYTVDAGLPPGLYLAEVRTKDSVHIQKLLLK